jgi:hypothetical protein
MRIDRNAGSTSNDRFKSTAGHNRQNQSQAKEDYPPASVVEVPVMQRPTPHNIHLDSRVLKRLTTDSTTHRTTGGSMKNRLLKELKELDLAMARLSDRRIDVTNMLGTLAALVALEPHVGEQIDQALTDGPRIQI